MTQNLRITGVISSAESNFNSANSFDVSEYSLDKEDSTYENHCDNVNGYNYACAKNSSSTEIGVWYNYYAASAGTIQTNDSLTNTTEDICPANWRLPTSPNTVSGTDANSLVGGTHSGWQDMNLSAIAFNPIPSGVYLNGNMVLTDYGYTWSGTSQNATVRYYFIWYNSTNNTISGTDGFYRYLGSPIRCILKDYLQSATATSLAAAMPNSGDSTTLYDSRDGNAYTVKNINGQYWMTQNLRLAGGIALTSADSNVQDDYIMPTSDFVGGRSYTAGELRDSGNTDTGFWYNYCAASAGTVCTGTESIDAVHDICPKGWRLPTGPNTVSGTDVNKLVGNTTSGEQSITAGFTAFNPTTGGRILYGGLNYTDTGYWWTATATDNATVHGMMWYNSTNNTVNGDTGNNKYVGYNVRCVFGPSA